MAKTGKTEQVAIKAPNLRVVAFEIEGTAPYVQNAFSGRVFYDIKKKQEDGAKSRSKKDREPKDFKRMYEEAQHRLQDKSHGIPANGFRAGLISACRTCGFVMTQAKLALFVEADGYDPVSLTPLVRITKGKPEQFESRVRLESGVMDIHARPLWRPGWRAMVRIRFDADRLSVSDVANLLNRMGTLVGIGEGRPDSRQSTGMGWGLFRIVSQEEKVA